MAAAAAGAGASRETAGSRGRGPSHVRAATHRLSPTRPPAAGSPSRDHGKAGGDGDEGDLEPVDLGPMVLSDVSKTHARRRFGWDRTARFAIVSRTEVTRTDDPFELLRKLFYVMLDVARERGWRWTPMQDRAAPLLDKRDSPGLGNSLAFSKCFVELALTLGHGFEEDQFEVVHIGGDRAFISKPYNGCGVDATYKGNLVPAGKTKLNGVSVLGKHFFVHSHKHIFDPTLGIEVSYFGRPGGWHEHEDYVVQAWLDKERADPQVGLWKAVDRHPRSSAVTYVSYDFSPREHRAAKWSLEATESAFVEMETEEGKGFLRMTYPNIAFHEEEEVRSMRLVGGGWFLWHVTADNRAALLEKEEEDERKRIEKKRQDRVKKIQAQRRAEALGMKVIYE